jgi:hypothetical protein
MPPLEIPTDARHIYPLNSQLRCYATFFLLPGHRLFWVIYQRRYLSIPPYATSNPPAFLLPALSCPCTPMRRFHPYPYHKRTAAPYDVEVQKRWLDAALTDGAPTLHHSTARSLAASISDHDPSSVELNRLQRELRVFNRNRQLVTFDPPTTSWRPFVRYVVIFLFLMLPYFSELSLSFSFSSPSRTIANGKTIPIQPSGYRNLPRTALPLCPHAYNKVRNEDECRMSYHTHQHPLLGSVPYLQVDPRTLHHCSFIRESLLSFHSLPLLADLIFS